MMSPVVGATVKKRGADGKLSVNAAAADEDAGNVGISEGGEGEGESEEGGEGEGEGEEGGGFMMQQQ